MQPYVAYSKRGKIIVEGKALSVFLKEFRIQWNMSQREAARHIGVSYVHLCRVEGGKASLSLEMLERVCNYYGIVLKIQVGDFDDFSS